MIKKNSLINIVKIILFYFLLYSASFKGIFLNSNIINFIPIFFTVVLISIFEINKSIDRKLEFYLLPLLIIFLIATSVFSYNNFNSFIEYLKYVILLLNIILIPFIFNSNFLKYFIIICLIWGVIVSLLFLNSLIILSGSFHYLTIGLPISISIILCFNLLLRIKDVPYKIILFLFIILNFYCLLKLPGRSVLFLPILFIILKLLYLKKYKNLILIFSSLIIFFIFFKNFILNFVSPYLIYRLNYFFNNSLSDENRYRDVLLPSFRKLYEWPFGYGIHSSYNLIGFYPHNIFLEIFLDLGFFGLLFFIYIIYVTIKKSIIIFKNNDFYLNQFVIIFWVLFLYWNTSFELNSASHIFTMCSIIINYKFINDKKDQCCNYNT